MMLCQWKQVPARAPYTKSTAKGEVLFLYNFLPDSFALRVGNWDEGFFRYQARPLESDYIEWKVTNVF